MTNKELELLTAMIERTYDTVTRVDEKMAPLIAKVEKHDTELTGLKWLGGLSMAGFVTYIVSWFTGRQ